MNELNAASAAPRCCPATYFGFPDRAASEPEALTVASPAPVSSAKRSWLVQWERTSLLGGVTRVCPVLTGVITSLAGCEPPGTRWISHSLIFPAQRNFEGSLMVELSPRRLFFDKSTAPKITASISTKQRFFLGSLGLRHLTSWRRRARVRQI